MCYTYTPEPQEQCHVKFMGKKGLSNTRLTFLNCAVILGLLLNYLVRLTAKIVERVKISAGVSKGTKIRYVIL